jgi:arylsulfatase
VFPLALADLMCFANKINKMTLTIDRPQLSPEDIKKLENTQATAVDGQPIHHLQGEPH